MSDRVEDILRREADVAVRYVEPTQAALISKRIGEMPVRLYAHRDYAESKGLPTSLARLREHPLIGSQADPGRLLRHGVLPFAPRQEHRQMANDEPGITTDRRRHQLR